jgi:tetratricopeptide (TPR) repeat protein
MPQIRSTTDQRGAGPTNAQPETHHAPDQQEAPPTIPDHELIRPIGGGSYGEVWLACNIMGTYRAVKIVYRRNFASDRPFEREFRGIQKFEPISRSHESQVDILHIGRGEGYFYYVMELADDAGPESGDGVPPERSDGAIECLSDSQTVQQSINPIIHQSNSPPPQHSSLSPPHPSTNPPIHQSKGSYVPKTLKLELQRRGRLPAGECLEIGLALATALDHLHRHGLVHRDVKPSNVIFVNGIPKLADIGLVTDVDGTVSFVGTEGFIPPEGPGTPQADIYSLGKVLYEISTGKDRQEFPEPPTMLGDFPDHGQVLELGEIVKRACAQRVQERYPNAQAMHADLLLMKLGKSVRRTHVLERRLARATRASVVAGMVALLALGAYLVAKRQVRQARETSAREAELREQAQASERKAQTAAAKSQEVARLLEEMLQGVGPSVALGRDTKLLRETLDKMAARLGTELAEQPEVEVELRLVLARTYHDMGLYQEMEETACGALELAQERLGPQTTDVAEALRLEGDALQHLGNLEQAEALARQALDLRRRLGSENEPGFAVYLDTLGEVLQSQSRLAEAETVLRQALAARRDLLGNEDNETASSIHNLASVLREEGQLDEAESLQREALAIQTKLFGPEHPTVALSLNNLALSVGNRGQYLEAEALWHQVLEMQRRLLGNEHQYVARALLNLATVLNKEGKTTEAEAAVREAIDLLRKIFGGEHPDLARALNSLGVLLNKQGKYEQAEALEREALAMQRKLEGPASLSIAATLNGLASTMRARGELAKAEKTYREALEMEETLVGKDHPDLGFFLSNLAVTLREQGDPGKLLEAETLTRRALEITTKRLGADHPNTIFWLNTLGAILRDQGRLPEAEAAFRDIVKRFFTGPNSVNPAARAQILANLANVLWLEKQLSEAETLVREALEIQRKVFGAKHPAVAGTLRQLADILRDEGQLDAAEATSREALGLQRDLAGAERPP